MLNLVSTGEKSVGLCQGSEQSCIVLRCCEVNLPRLVSLLTSSRWPQGKLASHLPKSNVLFLPWGGLHMWFMLREFSCTTNQSWVGWWREEGDGEDGLLRCQNWWEAAEQGSGCGQWWQDTHGVPEEISQISIMVELLQPLWYLEPWQQRSKLICVCTEMLSFQFWLQGWPSPTDNVCFLISNILVQISWTLPKRHSVDSVTPMWFLAGARCQNLNRACQGWCECLVSHWKKVWSWFYTCRKLLGRAS